MECCVFSKIISCAIRKTARVESLLSDNALKVHKIENFVDSDFGICVISLLVM
jgi:hypothetical protein